MIHSIAMHPTMVYFFPPITSLVKTGTLAHPALQLERWPIVVSCLFAICYAYAPQFLHQKRTRTAPPEPHFFPVRAHQKRTTGTGFSLEKGSGAFFLGTKSAPGAPVKPVRLPWAEPVLVDLAGWAQDPFGEVVQGSFEG